MDELLYNLIEKRLAELEADYKQITGTTLNDINYRLTNMEIRSELNKIQADYLMQAMNRYVPHKTLIHNTDPGDEQGVEL